MNEEHMRSIVIYGDTDFQALEKLKNIPSWEFHVNKQEGHPYYLQSGDTKVYLYKIADNVIHTSNVLPQDHAEKHPSFHNDILQKLSSDLDTSKIQHVLDISDSDKKLL